MPAPRPLVMTLLLAVAALVAGCSEPAQPTGVSPVVAADSEAARKAMADAQEVQALRQKQEAQAHRKSPKIPTDG